MAYCKQCHVHYESDQTMCVLCHQALDNVTGKEVSYYPTFKKKASLAPVIRYFMFANFMSMIITLIIDGQDFIWDYSLIVSMSNLYAIILTSFLFIPEFWTMKVSKILLTTLAGVFGIAFISGETYWFIDYVLPIVLGVNVVLYEIVSLFQKKHETDTVFHSLIIAFIGLIPGVMLFLNIVKDDLPSQFTLSLSIIVIFYIFLFQRKDLFEAMKRRFHL